MCASIARRRGGFAALVNQQLDPEEIRTYQIYLAKERRAAVGTRSVAAAPVFVEVSGEEVDLMQVTHLGVGCEVARVMTSIIRWRKAETLRMVGMG